MEAAAYNLVLDIGTTGIKAFLFDAQLQCVGKAYQKIFKAFPQPGWVEQDPMELLSVSISLLQRVITENHVAPEQVSAVGITNQRETTILWDAQTAAPVYPAIVWEDARTQQACAELLSREPMVRQKTGLTINPYFSASKIQWILQHVPEAKMLLDKEALRFGTVDSWILWNLSVHQTHSTDYTNASRTLLYDITKLDWDDELLQLFGVPRNILPIVQPSQAVVGVLKPEIIGAPIPIAAICGDQQSSLYAAGIAQGTTKITYGTGTFIVQSLGPEFALYDSFFTTLIPGVDQQPWYAVEGKVGAHGQLVEQYLNQPEQLHAVFDQVAQEVAAYVTKLPIRPQEIIVDGGFIQNEYFVQKQAQVLGIPVKKQLMFDGTALGVAKLLQERS